MNDIPELGGLYNICIVCEGEEEYEYLNKILSLDVWLDVYDKGYLIICYYLS